ncbi:MAG: SDR family NAD(P)-dependent oxidoreductase [Clostridia bacterium]|nr:SDR family NAD(P)-dependent oxidoreductase [Clostridia bacterium]
MKIAVITGASSGMGREFARQLTKQETFDEVWIIARRAERLETLAGELPYPTRILAMDLTKQESLSAYENLLKELKPEVSILINCSGFGKFGRYDQIPLQDCLDMIDLNCKALVAVTQLTLPYLKKGSRILQVDSLSAFQPVPYLNVYAATKGFVLRYSYALEAELKDRGIWVMAFCPGWVKTEFFDHAEQTSNTAVTYFNRTFTAEEAVKAGLKDLKRGKSVSVPGWQNKLQTLAVKFFPTKFVMWVWLKQQKH